MPGEGAHNRAATGRVDAGCVLVRDQLIGAESIDLESRDESGSRPRGRLAGGVRRLPSRLGAGSSGRAARGGRHDGMLPTRLRMASGVAGMWVLTDLHARSPGQFRLSFQGGAILGVPSRWPSQPAAASSPRGSSSRLGHQALNGDLRTGRLPSRPGVRVRRLRSIVSKQCR